MDTKFIIAVITAERSHVDIVGKTLRNAVPSVRLEQGCIQYNLYQNQSKYGQFVMVEQWRDSQALKAHCEAETFQNLLAVLDGRATLNVMELEKIIDYYPALLPDSSGHT